MLLLPLSRLVIQSSLCLLLHNLNHHQLFLRPNLRLLLLRHPHQYQNCRSHHVPGKGELRIQPRTVTSAKPQRRRCGARRILKEKTSPCATPVGSSGKRTRKSRRRLQLQWRRDFRSRYLPMTAAALAAGRDRHLRACNLAKGPT